MRYVCLLPAYLFSTMIISLLLSHLLNDIFPNKFTFFEVHACQSIFCVRTNAHATLLRTCTTNAHINVTKFTNEHADVYTPYYFL